MVEDSKERSASAEEEIRELERRLEEKKRELAEQGVPVAEEKEVFREILKKRIEEARPAPPAISVPGVSHKLTDDLQRKAEEVKKKEAREEQVRALIEIALTHNIAQAVKIAESATPYLLDELHDHLVDDYYGKLVQLRKLKQL